MTAVLPAQWIETIENTPLYREWTEQRLRRGPLRLLPKSWVREGIELDQHVREGRFQRSLALIAAGSALLGGLEVSYEHVIGSYSQRIMYSPVFLSGAVAVAGVWGTFDRRIARTLLPATSAALLIDGTVGFIFHIRGVQRKPGGWRLPVYNIVMGPPLFAPLLLGISGMLGLIASGLRREDSPLRFLPGRASSVESQIPGASWLRPLLPRRIHREELMLAQHVREGRFQKALAAAMAVSGLLNGAEALYSHYKTNYAYRSQWIPVALAPILAVAGFGAVADRRVARTLLPLASLAAIATGSLGLFYHGRGILRRPGGLKTPVYNILYGPPIFAPLLYAATGFLGLLASLLRRGD
ncbi:MAG TPA: hypothetical protein VH591_22705 [Ktedonobacterales bacterium]|jgi:hypothetical protein